MYLPSYSTLEAFSYLLIFQSHSQSITEARMQVNNNKKDRHRSAYSQHPNCEVSVTLRHREHEGQGKEDNFQPSKDRVP